MSKSTLILLLAAAASLGSLIGISLHDSTDPGPDRVITAKSAELTTARAPTIRYIEPGDIAGKVDEFGQTLPATVGENFLARNQTWKSEKVTIQLPIDGAIEYKAIMQQGDTLVFNWSTDGGPVYFDFHAHDTAFGDDFFTRYDEGEGTERSGAIIAAYDGQHGWFWLNIADNAITVTLTAAGFFDEITVVELEGY